jgi:DNA ligase 1
METIIKEFPTLFGDSQSGKVKEWSIKVISRNTEIYIITISGFVDGKLTPSERLVKEGKNIGKKNETTPIQQAIFEAEKKWKDKKEKEEYRENYEKGDKVDGKLEIILPMLAHRYELNSTKKKKKDIVYPCITQPKLDGIRSMSTLHNNEGKIIIYSRKGKEFYNMEHIKKELTNILNGKDYYLDGELYSEEIPFEMINGLVKKQKDTKKDEKEKMLKIRLHLYDIYILSSPNMGFKDRYNILKKLIESNNLQYISLVKNYDCNKKDDIKKMHDIYKEQGYEGIMLRNINGEYLIKNRSHDLQKYKEFLDDEYPIVGYHEGVGEDAGTIIWECEYINNEGKKDVFSVVIKGTNELRAQYLEECKKDFSQYKGKLLTVKYQELSEKNCPRFPVGIAIREDI